MKKVNEGFRKMYRLKISEYPSIQDAFNAIPAGVTRLDLGRDELGLSGANLLTVLTGIPGSVTILDLSYNDLFFLSGDDLKTALSGIPNS